MIYFLPSTIPPPFFSITLLEKSILSELETSRYQRSQRKKYQTGQEETGRQERRHLATLLQGVFHRILVIREILKLLHRKGFCFINKFGEDV